MISTDLVRTATYLMSLNQLRKLFCISTLKSTGTVVVSYFKITRHLPGEKMERCEGLQAGFPMPRPRLEPAIFRIQARHTIARVDFDDLYWT
jgi:hypothetical protein